MSTSTHHTTDSAPTREDYIELFDNISDAMELETAVLGDDGLPPFAEAVRDGEDDEPGPQYWGWLIEQATAGVREAMAVRASEVEL